MVLKSTLMIRYEAANTGVSTPQIIDLQNASAGMWAFAEGSLAGNLSFRACGGRK